ncbi:MAG: heavy-metal-associated domain-containing protein [Candidatus Dojkabacteria bacterium]|nr:heavy-metal-associated domain-containing protein [Candidatus Dojkabacteria bacterium]
MNNYKIQIKGMHCNGCKNLIQMSLEDESLQNVSVNPETGYANFNTDLSEEDTAKVLEKVFAELSDYSYSNLEKVD